MKFLRVGDELIRVDMITRIKEGRNNETFYGRSVRKNVDAWGWLELHFVGGEIVKIEGEPAEALRRYLESEDLIQDLNALV